MVHWAWLIASFTLGLFVGAFVPAWLRWSEGYDDQDHW
jgi:Na+/H+-dicarboxylate symporter